jgi:hypothetical protein
MSSNPKPEGSNDTLFFSCLDLLDEVFILRANLETCLKRGYFELALERRRSRSQHVELHQLDASRSISSATKPNDRDVQPARTGALPDSVESEYEPNAIERLHSRGLHLECARDSFTQAVQLIFQLEEKLQKVFTDATAFRDHESLR